MTTFKLGFVSAALFTLCFAGSANAFVASPALTGISADPLATPVNAPIVSHCWSARATARGFPELLRRAG